MSATVGFPSDLMPPVSGSRGSPKNSVSGRRSGGPAFVWARCGTVYAKLLHPVDQRRSFHPQVLGRPVPPADHPVARCQYTENMIPFYLREPIHRDIWFLGSLERFQFGS